MLTLLLALVCAAFAYGYLQFRDSQDQFDLLQKKYDAEILRKNTTPSVDLLQPQVPEE